MQNESNNIDDYTFAMRLQQKLYEDYNGLTHEIEPPIENKNKIASVANNAESAIDDDYATMQLQEMYNKERNVTHEDEDYAFAMQLQQLYNNELTNNRNKERVITKDDYEDLVPQMNNISFENSGENSEKFSNKSTNKKGGDRKGESYNDNFFQSDANKFDDDPPPYLSQRYSSNNSGMNNGYFPEQQFVPPQFPQQNYQKQNTTPNQPNYQDMFEMFTQFMGTFQNQNQKNSNQPNYDAYNNNQSRYYTNNNDAHNDNQSRYYTNNNNAHNNNQSRSYTHNFQRNNREPGVFKILLLGGTGTGKSTIINTMTSYFLGGTLDEPKIVIPTKYFKVTEKEFLNKDSETKIDDVTKSQTTKCHTYNFNHPDHPAYKFILIDTPGLSDTNGVKQDDKNIQEIIDAAIDAGSLSAIVIIANGTESRVTPSIKNTLVRLANNLPDDLLGNLLLVLTKCTKSSASFSEDAFSKEIAKPKKIFYMDNQFFCTNPQVWKDDDDERITVEFNWKKSNNTINKLLETIADLSSTSTKAFENMKEFRNRIKSEIVKVTQDITNIQKVQDSLEAAQKALQKTGNQKNSFANYTKSESITIKKVVSASAHSTVCTLHLTKSDIICHEGCGLSMETSSGTDHFIHCWCMGPNNICKQCGCGPRSHYHAMVKVVNETKTISKVLEDMKAQYDNANQQYQKYSADANTYQSSLSQLQSTVNAKYELIHKLCKDLSKICSRFNFVDELHANIESMRQDARLIQNINIRRNAEAEIARLEKLASDLSSKRGSMY